MMILDHRLDRRDFLVLSGSAAAAALVLSNTIGCGDRRRVPRVELIDAWEFDLASSCRCTQCIRREMAGPWQLPEETGPFWDHLRHEYECRQASLPRFEGDPTWH